MSILEYRSHGFTDIESQKLYSGHGDVEFTLTRYFFIQSTRGNQLFESMGLVRLYCSENTMYLTILKFLSVDRLNKVHTFIRVSTKNIEIKKRGSSFRFGSITFRDE